LNAVQETEGVRESEMNRIQKFALVSMIAVAPGMWVGATGSTFYISFAVFVMLAIVFLGT
jgi:hypothetical protein